MVWNLIGSYALLFIPVSSLAFSFFSFLTRALYPLPGFPLQLSALYYSFTTCLSGVVQVYLSPLLSIVWIIYSIRECS